MLCKDRFHKLIPTLDEADLEKIKQKRLIDGESDLFYKGSVLYSRIIDPIDGELYEDLDFIIRMFCDYDLETPYKGHEEDRGLMWQYAHEAFFVFVQHLKEWYVNYLKLKISNKFNLTNYATMLVILAIELVLINAAILWFRFIYLGD